MLFIIPNILFSQTIEREDTVLVVTEPDTTEIVSIDSTFYLKFLYPQDEPPIVYADTVILETETLPFIFNKRRIDLFPLTPPLFKKHYPTLEERFLPGKLFSDKYNRNYLYKRAYNEILDNHKELIKYSKEDLAGEVEKISEMESTIFQNLFKIDHDWDAAKKADKPQRYQPKRRYWVWKGNHFLQFSQTDDSKNWDKEGLGNINLLSTHSFTANFQKNKWQINQTMEWRLNLSNNPNDTLRWYRISEDKFRSYTTVGFPAYKHWSYSSNLEFTTQLLPNTIENKVDRITSFLSPFKVNTGVGMNYTLNKTYPNKTYPKLPGKRVVLTADISPLSIQYVNLLRSVVNPAQFGIKEGSSQLDFGTTLNAKLTINFSKSVSYMTRINYFTNYHKVYSEWEHDLNLPINRYFSMRLYFFATFDDMRTEDPKYGYVQMKETFSFGFNYAW
ncbi:hypothetical protein AGMMS50239_13870 [Bacteroidia bacterium]|nr:hypothetical protein AGMMS50239_13870 [Bacteroidia bacterium]GHV30475.1 hypothetical protein FACS1894177_03120 [Bacteroidia bacterium]